MKLRIPKGFRCSNKGIITMAKKKPAKTSGDIQRKRAASKAHVKSLQKTHKKLQTELKKFEKALASPLLIFHNR